MELPVFPTIARKKQVSISNPWIIESLSVNTATCFYIEHDGHKFIVSNAHVYDHASYLALIYDNKEHELQLIMSNKFIDIAVFKVPKDVEVFKPLKLVKYPNKTDKIVMYGYGNTGFAFNLHKLEVNIRTLHPYMNQGCELLTYSMSASMFHGQSGGPCVINNNGVIAVTTWGAKNANDDTSWLCVPSFTIISFIDMVIAGNFNMPVSNFNPLPVKSKALMSYYGYECSGSLVINSQSKQVLIGDYITHVDGYRLYDNMLFATVICDNELFKGWLVHIHHYMSIHSNKKYKFTIIRDNKEINVEYNMELAPSWLTRNPNHVRYFVYYKYVFIECIADNIARRSDVEQLWNHDIKEITCVSGSFFSDHNDAPEFKVIKSINDEMVTDLAHLKLLLEKSKKSKFTVIKFYSTNIITVIANDGWNQEQILKTYAGGFIDICNM
jgi:hypothetical protein